jgi:membrane protease YdiL (CAAX protease family)
MLLNSIFFSLLALSIVLAWTGIKIYQRLGLVFFLATLIVGVTIHRITPIGLCVIGILAAVMVVLRVKNLPIAYSLPLHLLLCVLFIGLSMHLIPGFHNWRIWDKLQLSDSSMPYAMYLNIEKPVYIFFFLFLNKHRSVLTYNWRKIFKWGLLSFALVLPLLFLGSKMLGFTAWDPKLPSYPIMGVWITYMLLDVTLGEEIFFRGYLQKQITMLLGRSSAAAWGACFLAAVLFGARHLPAGVSMAFMAMLAGIGYGFAYLRTKNMEAAVLTHFLVNLVHFFYFSYPMLNVDL